MCVCVIMMLECGKIFLAVHINFSPVSIDPNAVDCTSLEGKSIEPDSGTYNINV